MEKRSLELNCGKNADFDGFITIAFKSADGELQKKVDVDVWAELEEIGSTLNDDEKAGTKFLQGLRRFLLVKYQVKVSIWAAQDYYRTLNDLMEDAENFFMRKLDSPGSTDSSQPDGTAEKSDSSTVSSTDSEPKNT